jgi:hypothetical protein
MTTLAGRSLHVPVGDDAGPTTGLPVCSIGAPIAKIQISKDQWINLAVAVDAVNALST